LIQPSVYDDTSAKVFSDKMKNAFVTDTPGYPAHQHIVVNRIEELLKINIHGIGISYGLRSCCACSPKG
jgi:carbamoylphosphate synthase small subunit